MKKIMYVAFTLFIIVISFLEVQSYSIECDGFYTKGLESITIDKKQGQSNNDFVNEIEKIASENNFDIAYITLDERTGKTEYKIYKTNNTSDFYDISIDGNLQELSENECFSTKNSVDGYKTKHIKGLWLNSDYTISNFDEIKDKSLENVIYRIKASDLTNTMDCYTNKGYSVQLTTDNMSVQTSLDYFTYISQVFLPFVIMLISFVSYFLFNGKNVVLKKMEGFSNSDIRLEEWKRNIKAFLLIFLVIEIISCTIVQIISSNALIDFIKHSYINVLLSLIISIATFAVCSYIMSFQKSSEFIKGKNYNKLSFVILTVLKVFFSLFLIINLSNVLMTIYNAYGSYKSFENIAEKTRGYIYFTVSSENEDIFSLEAHDRITKKSKQLYNDTVDTLDGIIFSANNYSTDLYTGETAVNSEIYIDNEVYSLPKSIVINANYLKINPIYDINGKLISENDFKKDKYNFLVSEKNKDNYIQDISVPSSDYIENDINVIFYKADQDIHTFDPQASLMTEGKIDNPTIAIYSPDKDDYGNIGSYIACCYFVKTTTDEPYDELLPYIKDAGLENIILSVKSVSTSFSEMQNMYLHICIDYGTKAVVYTIGLLLLSFFMVKEYFEIFKNKIAIKKLIGYNFFNIHKTYLLITAVVDIIVLLLCIFRKYINILEAFNIWFWVAVVVIDIVMFILISKTYTRKTILEILKGN